VVFATITLPLAAPAAAAAFLLVFIPAAGEVVIPEVLGAPDSVLIGRAIWGEFFQTRDWPAAAALSSALLALLLAPIALYQRLSVAR
jgi:putrescine transport system permease protein